MCQNDTIIIMTPWRRQQGGEGWGWLQAVKNVWTHVFMSMAQNVYSHFEARDLLPKSLFYNPSLHYSFPFFCRGWSFNTQQFLGLWHIRRGAASANSKLSAVKWCNYWLLKHSTSCVTMALSQPWYSQENAHACTSTRPLMLRLIYTFVLKITYSSSWRAGGLAPKPVLWM